ncbi:UNVERIFIED_CONTAM: hypothetical protein HDU68_012388 [Siphonaria sp. JEL0065]|nr:hypothetical protein HDU68_012388 [Siphonaria sp. JEL0065]
MRAKTPPTNSILSSTVTAPTSLSTKTSTPPSEGPVSILRVKTPPTNPTSGISAKSSTTQATTTGLILHPTPPSQGKPPSRAGTLKSSNITITSAGRSLSTPASGTITSATSVGTGEIGQRRRTLATTTTATSTPSTTASQTLVSRNRVAAATAASLKRTGLNSGATVGSGIGYTSAIELKSSGTNSLGKGNSLGVVGADGTGGIVRVASAPVERQKRITFAPDVTGEGIDDVDISNSQSQRIAELESKLKETEKREQEAIKQKNTALKELETNKKFLVTDIKSNELLKTQLQEEHQTNASLIIFNRSLKTQVAELEGIIESLLQQKGATQLDITAVMNKIDQHKPVMPKITKTS